MKALIASIKLFEVNINKAFFLKIFLLAIIIIAIISVKISCIKTGYQISRITDELQKVRIKYESLRKIEYKYTNTGLLTEKSESLGMRHINLEHTFYVK
ncbi:hypothetical protein DSN97_06825 [Deferribacteraceae bacterium V6Fe1]|nr:hypothetical protein DSN97_06825 [Deferribacteraceae bacterium V6Fe1]